MLALLPASCGCGDGVGGVDGADGVDVVLMVWMVLVVWRTQHKMIHTQRWRDRRGALQESWNNNLLSDSAQVLPLYLSIQPISFDVLENIYREYHLINLWIR